MVQSVLLRGMTWDHSRGYDPMVATAAAYKNIHPEVEIIWEKRSLQAFADRPIDEMASEFDLMVIDHPHVGDVVSSGSLVALDDVAREKELQVLATQSVGPSHKSYQFDGHQWALAIDAATPVATYRPDRISTPPKNWSEVLDLAQQGQVAFALIPINALMVFFGLAKNMDMVIADTPDRFVSGEDGAIILELLVEIVAHMDPRCLALDPIGIFDWMGNEKDGPVYSPFGYGYTNYSRDGYCAYPLVFVDAPGVGDSGPRGTVLGGTGIAVSSKSSHRDIAVDYAFWIAGADCQSGLFYDAGGQPANSIAWESATCNASCQNFFINTRRTLETSWVRPRHAGYMAFQEKAGNIVHACLRNEVGITATVLALQNAYVESQI